MIDPLERRPPLFSTLLPTSLYAVLADVDADGNLPPKENGPQGAVVLMPEERCQSLTGNLWIVTDPSRLPQKVRIGNTLQIYAPGNHLAQEIGENRLLNPWLDTHGPPTLVISSFASGITGADRAMAQAMADELNDVAYMQELDTYSNAMLAHALYTNLRESISLEEHLANIHELQRFASASSGKIGDEIRRFLEAICSPHDKIGRYNTYRKVLIVRAVQRRAKTIVATKLDRVEEIIAAQKATTLYISDVDSLAGRAASVLADKQPWWTGDAGILPNVNRQLLGKFVVRLSGYAASFESIHANPFRPWAILAADRMRAMARSLEVKKFGAIHAYSMEARGYLEAIRIQTSVSRGIMSVRQKNGTSAAFDAFSSAISWSLQTAPRVAIIGDDVRNVVHNGQLGQRETQPERKIEHLRKIEYSIMMLGIKRAA